MKIIINQDSISRKIEGAFEICLSREDAQIIIDRLNEEISAGFTCGWVTIYEKPIVEVTANNPPKNWKE